MNGSIVGVAKGAQDPSAKTGELSPVFEDWSREWAVETWQGFPFKRVVKSAGGAGLTKLCACPIELRGTGVETHPDRPPVLMLVCVREERSNPQILHPSTDQHGFTPAETKVAEQIALGRSAQEIARVLGLSVHTVRSHIKRLLAKTGLHSQASLVRLLIEGAKAISPQESGEPLN
jgi:DNA-binding CsgD family transcriptional regulator